MAISKKKEARIKARAKNEKKEKLAAEKIRAEINEEKAKSDKADVLARKKAEKLANKPIKKGKT